MAAVLAGAIALASCAPVEGPETPTADVEPAVRVLGEGSRCLSATRIRSTVVLGDGVVDFTLSGGDVYRNRLAGRCPSLTRNDAITYDIKGGSLCRGELIYKLDTYGGELSRGPACSLGDFVPVEYRKELGDGPPIMGD